MSHTFTIPATVEALLQGLEASEWNFGSDREMANLCQHFLKSFEKATEAKLKDQRVYNRFVPDGNDPGKMYIFSTTSRETDLGLGLLSFQGQLSLARMLEKESDWTDDKQFLFEIKDTDEGTESTKGKKSQSWLVAIIKTNKQVEIQLHPSH